jgi:hypothetical protein
MPGPELPHPADALRVRINAAQQNEATFDLGWIAAFAAGVVAARYVSLFEAKRWSTALHATRDELERAYECDERTMVWMLALVHTGVCRAC